MNINNNVSIVPMDIQTQNWLETCIETAPNELSLIGCQETIEWFYSIDKDYNSFNYLIEKIRIKKLNIDGK
jgi:hypothetical protein